MFTWIAGNLGTLVIGLVLLGFVAAIIVSVRRQKKKGKHPSCGGNCGSCPMGGACHREE